MEIERKLQIYPGRDRAYELELARLKKARIDPRNKELIAEFQDFLFAGSKAIRVAKLSSQMRLICKWINTDLNLKKTLDRVTDKDVMRLVAHISQLEGRSDVTKSDYRRVLKQFYRWFKKEDSRLISKDEIRKVEATRLYDYLETEVPTGCRQRQVDSKTVLTDEDIVKVVEKGCKKPKDKAFISVLHETGVRAAEFLNLKIGDFVVKDGYAEINIPDGKTGKRIVYIHNSLPYLLKYLDVHPFKDNPNSYIWISDAQDSRKVNQPLVHIGAKRLIDRCFARAGVTKRHNLHWFRHSRASILAPKMTESLLCKFMGWTIGSEQVKTYVHLCSKQMEDVFLAMNGLRPHAEQVEKPIKCLCGTLNNPQDRYCYKCYKPLSVEVAIQDSTDEVRNLKLVTSEAMKTMQFFMEMQKNPEMMKKFEEFKKSISS